jgi:flagellar biosynthesis protein FlhB
LLSLHTHKTRNWRGNWRETKGEDPNSKFLSKRHEKGNFIFSLFISDSVQQLIILVILLINFFVPIKIFFFYYVHQFFTSSLAIDSDYFLVNATYASHIVAIRDY